MMKYHDSLNHVDISHLFKRFNIVNCYSRYPIGLQHHTKDIDYVYFAETTCNFTDQDSQTSSLVEREMKQGQIMYS